MLWTSCDDLLSVFQTLVNLGYLVMPIVETGFPCCGRPVTTRQGSNFESCVWRTVSSQSSHHPQEVLLAQFSLYVHKGGLKPDSFISCDDSLSVFQTLVNLGYLVMPIVGQGSRAVDVL